MLDDGERVLNLIGVALVVVIVVSVAAIALSSLSGQPDATPDADWTLTRVNDSFVRITHAGGEPVATTNLTVAVDGRPRHPAWTREVLTDGEHGVVRADGDATVVLFWEREAAKRRVLERWDLSESDSR